MNRNQRIRCCEFIKKYEDLPEAPESLKERILLAATRERNRHRVNNQVIFTLSCFIFLFTVTSNSLDNLYSLPASTSQPASVTSTNDTNNSMINSFSVVASPVLNLDRLEGESDFLDRFIQHKNWQSSLLGKGPSRL